LLFFSFVSQCAYWGFAGGHSELGNFYRAIAVETMHMADQGLTVMFLGLVKEKLKETRETKFLKEMDIRLSILKTQYRYPEFRLPLDHFSSNSTSTAQEHRSVLQVRNFLLVGLISINHFVNFPNRFCHLSFKVSLMIMS
jgi:hypothetical protein